MPLSDAAIRSAKSKNKPYKLADGKGLFLLVNPSGSKLWRFKYAYLGKEKSLSLGAYPAVGLKKARADSDAAREELAARKDPSFEKKKREIAETLSAATTFGTVAAEYIEKRAKEGVATATTYKSTWLISELGRDLSDRPIADIEPFEVLNSLKKIEKQGKRESARKARSLASRVFRYAIATGRAKSDPADVLRGALLAPQPKHFAALLDPEQVGGLLRAIDSFEGQPATLWALRMAPHVFVRPGELRQAQWSEIDLETAVWRIPATRMKMKREHAVPLSRQVVEILTNMKAITGRGRYVFPSVRTHLRPMSENTVNGALRRLGYSNDEMTSHGFRATASSLLNESGKWSSDAIERALAHGDSNKIRAAYHRGAHWKERVEMAQWWSDYLDELKGAVPRR